MNYIQMMAEKVCTASTPKRSNLSLSADRFASIIGTDQAVATEWMTRMDDSSYFRMLHK